MSLFEMMRKTNEAQAVRLGIPVDRQFSDDELADSMQALRDMYGDMSTEECMGKLGSDEKRILGELNRKLITFRVTVTTASQTETINIMAPNSCAATVQVVEMLFGGFEADKPESFKLKVEPMQMQQRDQRRAA